MVSAEHRGQVIGAITTGLLLGVLLSRTFSGLIAQWPSWRMVYVIGAVMLLSMATVLQYRLPTQQKLFSHLGYGATLRSVWCLL